MSFFNDNADTIDIGMHGEGLVRDYLKKTGYKFMQVDIIAEKGDKIYLIEVKSQEKYKDPDSHGLPEYQIKERIRLAEKTGMIPILYIYDLEDNVFYVQDMRVLMLSEEKFFSKTGKRVLFPIESFVVLEVPQ